MVGAVHPHVRGEHDSLRQSKTQGYSVHPHVRGEHYRHGWQCHYARRFIPTCVGNTQSPQKLIRTAGRFIPTCVGNTPIRLYQHYRVRRFIPTCVGNTCARGIVCHGRSVHPHVRGEHNIRELVSRGCFGSSPRAWGTRVLSMGEELLERFIPTCVGNTFWRRIQY